MVSLSVITGMILGAIGVSLVIAIPISIIILWRMNSNLKRKALEESMKGGFKYGIKEKEQIERRDTTEYERAGRSGGSGRSGGTGGGELNGEHRSIKEYLTEQRRVPLPTDSLYTQDTRTDDYPKRNSKQDWPSFE